ncbi:MAG TPA: SurA N-terminal domain-containing protein [Rhodocyclaceae bacterium]|jgi:peptidyl-prolyl cis-trans isomerase D|nr:SurA N-terminal domain-containing protein [Rhodocyclaceae bacterium]
MFDSVRNNKRLVQIFLLLITLPFAFWGVESYVRNAAGGDDVAQVGSSKITQQEFQQALRLQGERMRNASGAQFNPATMEKPEVRLAILEELIKQRLVTQYAADAHLFVSKDQLISVITSVDALKVNGKFSVELYEQAAAAQGLSKAGLDARIKKDLASGQAMSVVVDAAVASRTAGNAFVAAALEEREISEMLLKPDAYLAQVKLAPNAAKTYYDTNQTKFQMPEQVRFEFVVLSQKDFEQKNLVSDAEIKAAYEANPDRYKLPEERRASHILIMADKDAKPDVLKAAEAKVNDLLAQAKKNPADFAKLAKQYSQDVVSAKQGGDVGFITRNGGMVKPFEDAVFALKENQISDVVRTEYGFHIVRLTAIKAPHVKPLADVKDDIAAELKAQGVAKKYAEAAESFTDLVDSQPDSLQPAIEKFGLKAQQSPWLAKGKQIPGFNEKLLTALFSDDAIKGKHNTQAVEIAPNTLMSARIIEHKPAGLLPLAQVQAEIEKHLKEDEAVKLAIADAEARIAKLNAGDTSGTSWGAARSVARSGSEGVSAQTLRAVFKVNTDKLPAYTYATLQDGSAALYRVSKVKPYVPGEKDDPKAAALRQQYVQMETAADFAAWLASLRERYKVTINRAAVEVKDAK